ncbi:hypothetical protein DET47_11810 [Shewanella putrefaciens]|nr:hypothetical protein DET47_11810 [Shewanella putrefaciens]
MPNNDDFITALSCGLSAAEIITAADNLSFAF